MCLVFMYAFHRTYLSIIEAPSVFKEHLRHEVKQTTKDQRNGLSLLQQPANQFVLETA